MEQTTVQMVKRRVKISTLGIGNHIPEGYAPAYGKLKKNVEKFNEEKVFLTHCTMATEHLCEAKER